MCARGELCVTKIGHGVADGNGIAVVIKIFAIQSRYSNTRYVVLVHHGYNVVAADLPGRAKVFVVDERGIVSFSNGCALHIAV